MKHGHSLKDVQEVYTIDQVHLFYRLALADELRNDSILVQGNFLALQAVVGGALGGKSAGKEAFKHYTDFIASLDLNVLQAKKQKAAKHAADPAAVCSKLGIFSGAKRERN